MRIIMMTAAALALTSGIAAANPGLDQLAASAGVSGNGLSQAQLIQILDAQRDNDTQRVEFILSQAGQGSVAISNMGGAGASVDAQLAARAGVEPGRFTTNELERLIRADRENDTQTRAFILSGESRADANPSNVVTPGQEQLAAVLGVNAADYSLAELTVLYADLVEVRS
jgi:hypothetical protein